MRPVCRPSSSTDSSSSAGSSPISPSSTAATSSARRCFISSSLACARTACTSASTTSRASPWRPSSVIADQRPQLVLEAARLDRAVDPALLRSVRLPPPAARAKILALLGRARARPAADRRLALVVERVVGQLVLAHVIPHLVLRPLRQRVELDDRAVIVVDLDLADVAARRPLVAPEARDP